MSHPPPPFAPSSGTFLPASRTLTALTLSPATSPTDGPGFDTLTTEGVGVFVPLWAIRRALEAEEGREEEEEEEEEEEGTRGGGGAATTPTPSRRLQAPRSSGALQPSLFPSLPLLSSSCTSACSSNVRTPFEGVGPGGGGTRARARASFAFPPASTSSSALPTQTALAPAYLPPSPYSHPRPRPRPVDSPSPSNSDSESDFSQHASPALAGPALARARSVFLARDHAYVSQRSLPDDRGGERRGRGSGRVREEEDPEWVPEGRVERGEGRRERARGKGRKVGSVDTEEAGVGGGAAFVTEPATEPLSIRWTPSLRRFLPSDAPYPSQPATKTTLVTLPPHAHVRVYTSPSRAPESEVLPYSSSSAKRNTYLRALLSYRFPSLTCTCGFGFLRPVKGDGAEGAWKRPSLIRDHLARCTSLGETDGVKRMCALERGFEAGTGEGRRERVEAE